MALKIGVIDFVTARKLPGEEKVQGASLHANVSHAFRVGSGQLDTTLDHIPADTLFSGLCHAWADLYGSEEENGGLRQFLKAFPRLLLEPEPRMEKEDGVVGPPLRLSSAFPILVNRDLSRSHPSFFYPSPASPLPGSLMDNPHHHVFLKHGRKHGRALKDLPYVSPEQCRIWLDWNGRRSERDLRDFYTDIEKVHRPVENRLTSKAQIALSSTRETEVFSVASVHSLGAPTLLMPQGYPAPFYRRALLEGYKTRVQYAFWAELDDAWWKTAGGEEILTRVMSRLAVRGIGGKRSTAMGTFSFRWLDARDMPSPRLRPSASSTEAGWHYLLGPMYPTYAMQCSPQWSQGFYNLANKGGWSEGGVRRMGLRFVEAGSLVWMDSECGYLVDVTPPGWGGSHPIYRFSAPLSLALGPTLPGNAVAPL